MTSGPILGTRLRAWGALIAIMLLAAIIPVRSSQSCSQCGTDEMQASDVKPSSRLSPRAKKAFMRSAPDSRVNGLAQLAPAANVNAISSAVQSLGGVAGAWSATTRQLSVTLPAGCLNEFAALKGVVYFEAAEAYSR